jgi:hypothetical protein
MVGLEGGVSEYHDKAARRMLDVADDGEYRKSTWVLGESKYSGGR